jgi:hypothetical protein
MENDEGINVWLFQIIEPHKFGIFYEIIMSSGMWNRALWLKFEESGSMLLPNVGKFQQDIPAPCNIRTQASESLSYAPQSSRIFYTY